VPYNQVSFGDVSIEFSPKFVELVLESLVYCGKHRRMQVDQKGNDNVPSNSGAIFYFA